MRKFKCPFENGGSRVSCDVVDLLIEGAPAYEVRDSEGRIMGVFHREEAEKRRSGEALSNCDRAIAIQGYFRRKSGTMTSAH